MSTGQPDDPIRTEELSREGAHRVYKVRVPASHLDSLKTRRLEELGRSVRLPGFRPGKIPTNILEKRYGAKARSEAANRLAAEAADRIFATGGLPSAIEPLSGADSGDLEFRVAVTHLPDLPGLDFTKLAIERFSASPADVETAGLTTDEASGLFNDHLRQQVLDYLDSAYAFPIAPQLVEREFAAIHQLAESQLDPGMGDAEARASMAAELHVIAERRVRLGAVMVELARRFGIALPEADRKTQSGLLEDTVVRHLIANARVSDRIISSDELRDLAG
jgi:FKBP-type peptidyl-prolyl cis-trans isomerase (trigger factor)